MLNPEIIAENIIYLRQQRNMTQQQLAARVSVTHQAVSKWENGSSIPDLQTLMTLSRLFEVTLDDLLTEVLSARTESAAAPEEAAPEASPEHTLEESIESSIEDCIENNIERSIEESIKSGIENGFAAASSADHAQKKDDAPSIGRLITKAPFMKRSELRAQVMQLAPEKTDLRQLVGLAPFLDHDTLDLIAARIAQKNGLSGLTGLAPFLSRDTLDRLVAQLDPKNADLGRITGLAPFLSRDTLDRLVAHLDPSTADLGRITGLVPFLSRDTLDRLVSQLDPKNADLDRITGLAPFISRDTLDRLVSQLDPKNADLGRITGLAPFISRDTLDRLVSQLDPDTVDRCTLVSLAPFLSGSVLARFPDLADSDLAASHGRLSFLTNLFKNPHVTVRTSRSPAPDNDSDARCTPECIDQAIAECDWGYIEDHIAALTPDQAQQAALAAAEDGYLDFIPALHLNDDVLSQVAVSAADQGDIDELVESLPIDRLNDKAQHALFAALIDSDDTDVLLAHPVFRQGDYLRQLALHLAENDEFDALEQLPLDNLDAATLNAVVLMAIESGEADFAAQHLMALSEDKRRHAAMLLAENDEFDTLEQLADQLDEDTVSRLIEQAIDSDNLDWIERRIRRLPARDQAKIAVFWAESEDWSSIARRIDLSVLPDTVLDRLIDLAEEQGEATPLRRLMTARQH